MDELDDILKLYRQPARTLAPKENDKQFRDFFTQKGFKVNRTFGKAINKGSLHPYGLAADIDFNGKSDDEIGDLVESALRKGYRVFDERVKQPGVKQTGPHLHFERNNGEKPSAFLNGRYGKRDLKYLTDLDNARLGKGIAPSKGETLDDIISLYTQPSPTNPVNPPKVNIPAPEAPETINAQIQSTLDPNSPKKGTLITPGEQIPTLGGLQVIDVPEGKLAVNPAKGQPRSLAEAIGKVQDVGNNTRGMTVLTTDAQGNELSASIVRDPKAAAEQVKLDKQMYPQAVNHELLPSDEVARRRAEITRNPFQSPDARQFPWSMMLPNEMPETQESIRDKREWEKWGPVYRQFLVDEKLEDSPEALKRFNTKMQALSATQREKTRKVARKSNLDAQVGSEEKTYKFDETGVLAFENGKKLFVDNSKEVPVNTTRFRDDEGETYLFDRTTGKLQDESLSDIADTFPVSRVPYTQKATTPLRQAQEHRAVQVARALATKYGMNEDDVYQWVMQRGFTDPEASKAQGRDVPLPEDRYYESDAQGLIRNQTNYNRQGSSIGAPGTKPPTGEISSSDTHSLTRRQMRELEAFTSEQKAKREQAVLKMISEGREPDAKTLRSLGVSLDELRSKQYDEFEMARVKGRVNQADIDRFKAEYRSQGNDERLAELKALQRKGIGGKEVSTEIANYENRRREIAEEVRKYGGLFKEGGYAEKKYGYAPQTQTPEDIDRKVNAQIAKEIQAYGSITAFVNKQKKAEAEERARIERIKNDPTSKKVFEYVKGYSAGVAGSAVEGIGDLVKGFPIWTKPVADYIDSLFGTNHRDLKNHPFTQLGQGIKDAGQFIKDWQSRDYQKEFWAGSIPQDLGKSIAFMPAAAGGPLGISLFAIMQMTGSSHDEAIEAGAKPETAEKYGQLVGGLLGWTERFGLGESWQRLIKGQGGKRIKGILLDALKESAEEVFVNELPQSLGQNYLAKLTFDPARQWDKDLADSLGAAGVSAPVASILISGLLHIKHRRQIAQVVKDDMVNGGPLVRDFGEGGVFVSGKQIQVTKELEPLLQKHREYQKEIQTGFDDIKEAKKRKEAAKFNDKPRYDRIIDDIRREQFRVMLEQQKVAGAIARLSGSVPSIVEQKESAEKQTQTQRITLKPLNETKAPTPQKPAPVAQTPLATDTPVEDTNTEERLNKARGVLRSNGSRVYTDEETVKAIGSLTTEDEIFDTLDFGENITLANKAREKSGTSKALNSGMGREALDQSPRHREQLALIRLRPKIEKETDPLKKFAMLVNPEAWGASHSDLLKDNYSPEAKVLKLRVQPEKGAFDRAISFLREGGRNEAADLLQAEYDRQMAEGWGQTPLPQKSAPVDTKALAKDTPVESNAEPKSVESLLKYYEEAPTDLIPEAPLRPSTLEGAKNRIKEVEEQRDIARREAETSPLSGLPNKRAFDKALPQAEKDPNTSVVFFDLDQFKAYNDAEGQQKGDALLKKVADAVNKAKDEVGVARENFHFGGDEFAALPPTDKAEQFLKRAQEIFGEVRVGDKVVSLTGGIGQTFREAEKNGKEAKKARKIEIGKREGLTVTDREGNILYQPEESKKANPVTKTVEETPQKGKKKILSTDPIYAKYDIEKDSTNYQYVSNQLNKIEKMIDEATDLTVKAGLVKRQKQLQENHSVATKEYAADLKDRTKKEKQIKDKWKKEASTATDEQLQTGLKNLKRVTDITSTNIGANVRQQIIEDEINRRQNVTTKEEGGNKASPKTSAKQKLAEKVKQKDALQGESKPQTKPKTAKKTVLIPARDRKTYAKAGLTEAEVQEQISTPEFQKAEELSKKQKEDKTGFTPAQKQYLARELENYAKENKDTPYKGADEWRLSLPKRGDKYQLSGTYSIPANRTATETFIVPDDGTFTVHNLAQANRLYQRITGKPLKGQPKEKIPTVTLNKSLPQMPSTAKGSNASRAKGLINFTPENYAEATVDIPIDELNDGYIAAIPMDSIPKQVSTGLSPNGGSGTRIDGGWMETTLKGQTAYSEGHVILVGSEPFGKGVSERKVNGDDAIGNEKTFKDVEPVRAVSIGKGRSVVVEFSDGQVIPFEQYNLVKSRFPTVSFKSRKDMVAFYDEGKLIGAAMTVKNPQVDEAPASLETPKETPKKETASKEQFQDYGEKIGGAKKDIYQRLEVTDSDLETQPLSKTFPRPDFAKLINEGSITKDAAKILSFIYDNIPPKPRKKYKVAGWVKQVNGVIDIYKQAFGEQPDAAEQLLEGLRKAQKQGLSKAADAFETYSAWLDVTGFPDKSLSMQGYALKKVQPWKKDASPEPEYLVVKGPFIKGQYKDAKTAAEALYKILTASPSGPKTSFSIYEDRKTKELFIGKKGASGVVRLVEGFKTLKEAREFQQANQTSLEEMWEAKKYKAGIERKDSGEETRVGKDWRKGKDIASTEEFAKTFGFKGVEFGNWVKQGSTKNERQQAINDAYDALMDLADILNIDPKALSLNGTLSLALGARGSGMASAHYEPGKVVINLTKTRGKGSLGHEWWHALDNYFSRMRGDKSGYVTDFPRVGRIKDSGMFIDDPRVRKELLDAYRGVVDEIRASGMPRRSARMDATRSQAYWSTIVEMSARAFENYLITELGQQGRQSDHLANFRDMGEWAKLSLDPEAFPYPLDAEQGPINDAFRELFKTIKQRPTDEGNISLEMPAPDTDAFKKWFGDSKVVDKDGKPLVVYRGESGGSDFDIFDRAKTRESGFFFTPDAEIATIYARGKKPRQFFLKAEKLLDLTKDDIETRAWIDRWGENFDDWTDRRSGETVSPADAVQGGGLFDWEGDWSGERWKDLIATAEYEGYDGAIVPDWDNSKGIFPSYVVFSPTQIKSAIGNKGTFDPNNPSILEMPADSGSFKLQGDAQYAHPQDLLDRAKSSITDDGHIELNVEAGELLRRIAGKSNLFFALTHKKGTLIQLARKIDRKLDEFRKVGYSDAEIKVLSDLADQLREIAKSGAGVTYIFDFALPHETHHQMVLNALGDNVFPEESVDELSKLDVWKNPKVKQPTGQVSTFNKLYPNARGVTKAFEIAAMLDTGEIQSKDKERFLQIFAQGIRKASPEINEANFARIFQYDSTPSNARGDTETGSEHQEDRSTSEDRQASPTEEKANQEAGTRPGDGQVQRPDSGTEVSVENKVVRQLADYDRLFKKRQYAETLRENGYEDTPDVPYIPDTEKKWLEDAQRRISASKHDDYRTAEKSFYEDNMEPQQRTALGIGLLDHLGSIGELERMIKVSEELVKHVGTAAQALRASQLAGKYDFVTGMMIATRAVQKAGKELTAKDAEKVRELLTRIAQTEEEKASLTYLNQELETAVKEADKNIKELEDALNGAQAERKVDEKTIARLKKQIATLKENRPRTYHAKQKAELERAKPDLEKILREAFSLAMPSGEQSVTPDNYHEYEYPMASETVDGRTVRAGVPNMSSIGASLIDYDVLDGIREVPLSAFTPTQSYSASEKQRTEALAEEIRDSNEISPLIVVIDSEGPYILEGGHRFDALNILKAKSFPAKVVFDWDSIYPDSLEMPAPDTDAFKKWFGDSKVVDADGKPLRVYHGTKADITEFRPTKSYEQSLIFFSRDPKMASSWAVNNASTPDGLRRNYVPVAEIKKAEAEYREKYEAQLLAAAEASDWVEYDRIRALRPTPESQVFRDTDSTVYPVYLKVENPFDPRKDYKLIEPLLKTIPSMSGILADGTHKAGNWVVYENDQVKRFIREQGYDGIYLTEEADYTGEKPHDTIAVFSPTQIKSAIGNKGTFDPNNPSILEMPADDRVHNALVDMASLDILNYVSPEDTIEHLRDLTNNMLSEDELREIHLEAFEATKTESNITPEARKNSAIRMAHRRMAMQTAKPDVQKVRERPSRYDKEVITFGRNNGYTDKEILGAILFPKIKGAHSVNEWKKLVDGDDDTFKRSRELRQKVNNDIQDQIIKAKADREGYKGDLEKFKNEVIHNGISGREARKAFDNYARKLSRSLGRKAFDFASETVSLFKGLSAWGEISYIGRQGFIPLLTDTRAAMKGDWEGIGHGLQGDNEMWKFLANKAGFENAAEYLSNHSLSVFVEQIRQHPRFLAAQNNGVRFTHIGDFNVADDHFATQMLEKVPFYRRAEVAYTLPGDLQRLYIYDTWATMLEQQNLSAEEMKKALKYTAEVANAFTGKGDVNRVLAKGGALSKALNLALFSPQLLFSRFQSLNKLTLGWATAPKGLKIQMAKKGLRFYGILAVIAALTGMVIDPEDEDFGKINKGDTHLDILAGLDVPAQLYLRTAMGFVKSVINQDTAYLADDIQANIREFGVSKEGQPRFVRSKLSPGASLAVDAYTGTDFIGRPFTWWGGLTSRSVPLAWQQTYDALLYDRYREMVKEPRTFEYAVNKFNEHERNYLNALMVMAGTFTGIGITQYPKADRTKAVQLAAQISPFVSKKDAEQRRIEGGLRSLLADKFDLLKQGKDTRKVDMEIERWMRINPDLNKKFSAINSQAGSKTGLIALYAKDLPVEALKRVLQVADDPDERAVIEKLIRKQSK